jgi:hypothetical protein
MYLNEKSSCPYIILVDFKNNLKDFLKEED